MSTFFKHKQIASFVVANFQTLLTLRAKTDQTFSVYAHTVGHYGTPPFLLYSIEQIDKNG